jgi:hypothetical protein
MKKSISYGQCRVGTTTFKVPIRRVEIEQDGRVAVYVTISHDISGTVNRVQLYDQEGELFADKAVSIIKDTTQGVLIKISFLIQEV